MPGLTEIQTKTYCKVVSGLQVDLNEANKLRKIAEAEVNRLLEENTTLASKLDAKLPPVYISVGAIA